MRPIIRNKNPDATPQEIIILLNEAWNKEKEAGNKKIWEKKAIESYVPAPVKIKVDSNNRGGDLAGELLIANNAIRKCNMCGLMISNVNRHMLLYHNGGNAVAEELEPGEETTTIDEASTHDNNFVEPFHIFEETDCNEVVSVNTVPVMETSEKDADEEKFLE